MVQNSNGMDSSTNALKGIQRVGQNLCSQRHAVPLSSAGYRVK